MNRRLTAEIDLEAAALNLTSIIRKVHGLPVFAVVKADAYGHGAVELSRIFQNSGAYAMAVAFVSEARELREGGITIPILVLFDSSELSAYFELGLTPVIHDFKTAKAFSAEAGKRRTPIGIHIKVDTGMGRLGFTDKEQILQVTQLPDIRVEGLLSHFSEADLEDRDFIGYQLAEFHSLKKMLADKGIRPLCHMANSAAVLSYPDSYLDAVRPGLVLYGHLPFEGYVTENLPDVRHLMKVKTDILALRRLKAGQPVSYSRTFITTRETLAAVLAAGYADGYPRALSNNSHVIINGKKAPVIGRVCMDLTIADVTDAGEINEHDEAVLLGTDRGETITAWDLARGASTIPYEILTALGTNSRRIYKGS